MGSPVRPIAILLAAIGCLATATPSLVQAADSRPKFNATRHPFQPGLVINERPAVCERVLAAVTARFLDPDIHLREIADEPSKKEWPPVGWFGFEPPHVRYATITAGGHKRVMPIIDWDLNGDGDPETLGLHLGDLLSAYRYELITIPKEAVGAPAPKPARFYITDNEFLSGLDAGIESPLLASWFIPFVLFTHDGELFAHFRGSPFSPWRPIVVYRLSLKEGGRRRLKHVVCKIELASGGWTPRQSEMMPELRGFAGFLESTEAALGTSPNCASSGANRSSSMHNAYYWNSIWTIINRPWGIRSEVAWTSSRDLSAADDILLYWAHSGLWEYRKYREMRAVRRAAVPSLARWYEERFGLQRQDAQTWARYATVSATETLTNSAYLPGAYLETNDDISRQDAELRIRLLEGASGDVVEQLLADGASLGYVKSSFFSAEPALFYALEHPRLVRLLLERGAEVDATNHFGKTALMYAAQFNLPETARILLAAGADPNRRTTRKPFRGCNPFARIGRTPLMYAAENADESMMALLIDAGANVAAHDILNKYRHKGPTLGRSIADYLAHNASLDESARERIRRRWNIE